MEEYHDLSPDNWGKFFTNWFTKCSDGYNPISPEQIENKMNLIPFYTPLQAA